MSGHATPTPPDSDRLATFRLDVEYTRIASELDAAGVRTVLLKGPAFDRLLFDGRRVRAYTDIDLLVDPASVPTAERVLERLGFRAAEPRTGLRRLARRAGIALGTSSAHATPWIGDRLIVDLHRALPRVGVSPDEAWRVLVAHIATITVVGAVAETLDPPASALLIALHAAHHGPRWQRARTDLERACEAFDRPCWEAAARLARDLRADGAMGTGLGTAAKGRALARELGLSTMPSLAYRLRWSRAR
jgi:hypothetical protein